MRWPMSGAVPASSGALLAGTVVAWAGVLLAGAATVPRVCAAVGLHQAEAPQSGDATAVVRAADAEPYRAARLRTGAVPAVPVQAVGAGQVYLDLAVTSGGAVSAVRTLRVTPPFTEPLAAAVAAWRFRPAEEEEPVQKPESAVASAAAGQGAAPKVRHPVASRVLVAGWFRPPTLNTPALGTPPQDVAEGSEEAPFPMSTDMPAYPPLARDSGAVLVEVHVDRAGRVDRAAIVRSGGVFDVPALEAARRWTFRPARVKGALVGAYVYLVFGFRQPVTTK